MERARMRLWWRVAGGGALVALGVSLGWLLVDDMPVVVHKAGERPENLVMIWGDETVGQSFRPPPPNVSGIELSFRGPPRTNVGEVILHVRRSPDAEDLRTVRQTIGRTRRDVSSRFSFSPLAVSGDDTWYLFVEYPDGTADKPLGVRAELPLPKVRSTISVDYPAGTLFRNDSSAEGDLAFQVIGRGRKPFATQVAGALILSGTTLLAVAVLTALRPQWAPRGGLLLLAGGLPIVFLLPFLSHLTFFGTGDWDMNATMFAAAEHTLSAEHAFPAWNPYLCGGTPLSAFPESPVFSPFFMTTILTGPIIGPKVNTALHLVIGFAGMLLLLRRGWQVSWPAAFLGTAVTMFSSFVALHLFAGHSRKMAIAWMPWVFLFLDRAMGTQEARPASHRAHLPYAAPAAGALALMFLDGSVYLSLYTTAAVAVLSGFSALIWRRTQPLLAGMLTMTLAGLLAGVHLVPVLSSQSHLQTALEQPAPFPPRTLIDIFLDPNQDPYAQKFDGQLLPWFEYGAYVGMVPAALFVLGAFWMPKRFAPWLLTGAVFLLGTFWSPAQRVLGVVPILGDLRNPQRMAVMVILIVGVGAALGLERVRRWLISKQPSNVPDLSPAAGLALNIFVTLLIGHLVFVNQETLGSIFTIPPPHRPTRHTIDASQPFRQGWAKETFIGTSDSFLFTMGHTLKNRGSVNRCSVAAVRPTVGLRVPPDASEAANDFRDETYTGEAFILDGDGEIRITRHRTTAVDVAVTARTPLVVALNQNFHPGWHGTILQDGSTPTILAAQPRNGLVSATFPPGKGTLHLAYAPPRLPLGLLLTALGCVGALALWRFR